MPVPQTAETWRAVREAYLAGGNAADLAEHFGVSRSQLHARAKAEGWRLADAPAPALEEPPFDPHAPERAPADLAAQAFRRLAHAIDRGALREALGWMRLHKELTRLAAPPPGARTRDGLDEAIATAHAVTGLARAAERALDAAPADRDRAWTTLDTAAALSPAESDGRTFAAQAIDAPAPDSPDSFFPHPLATQAHLSKRALRRLRARG